jgi:Peptidase C39 family
MYLGGALIQDPGDGWALAMTEFLRRFGAVVALFVSVMASGVGRGSEQEAANDTIWRSLERCPVNTLFVVLRLHGKDVSYAEIRDQLPVGQGGSSLADMRDFAVRHGLPARVLKPTPARLAQMRMPVIAHVEEERTAGHYVVLLQIGTTADSQQMVEYIDGTTGLIGHMDWTTFKKQWTGFVLTFDTEPGRTDWLLLAAVHLGVLLVALILIRIRLDRTRKGREGGRVSELATSAARPG